MEYVLGKIKNGFIMLWLAFCFIIFLLTLILYFTEDKLRYSQIYRLGKKESLKLKSLLDNDEHVQFNATWISDDEILTQDNSKNIVLFDVNYSIKSVLAFNSMQHIKYCQTYELSADRKYLLIGYNINKSFSYLSTGNYDIINISTGKQVTLRDTNHRPRDVMIVRWSPIGSSLIIVDNFNIYYISTAAKPNYAKQITFHGSEDLYNGVSDWVYKKELFGSHNAMWFSKQGTKIAYATFNETLVPSVFLPTYGIPDTMYDQYSKIFSYRYPKVNDPNPTVELFVQSLDITNELKPIPIKPVKQYKNETLLCNVIWSDDEHLFAVWMNRIQNESHIVHYHISNNTAKIIDVMEFSQENGWFDFHKSMFINPIHQIALINRMKQDDGDFYGHVCVIQPNGKLAPLTEGKFEVTRLIKWDFESNYIYYLANLENGYEKQHVFRVLVDSKLLSLLNPECLTCNTGCTYSDAMFSEKYTYFMHKCMGPNIPYINIMKTNGDIITEWHINKSLKNEIENVILPRVYFINVPLVDGYEARVKLLIPPTLSSDSKYPLLIYSNGGPTDDIVLAKFEINVNTYLSVNHDVIVAEIAGRGTARKGSNMLFANYMKLGSNEIDDQILVAKYLQITMPYVDGNKIGIWGWGFGGYVAGMVLAKDDEKIFKCALSVAPITNWIYYNSIYTERLMSSYQENLEGYRNASLIENSEGLRHKKFMVIHGMFDNNVHFQHSTLLSKEMQKDEIMFEQQFYPDESHRLPNVKNHFYRTMILFILKCFA